MVTYRFSVGPKSTLECYKVDKALSKFHGKNALKKLKTAKEYDYISYKTTTKKINENKEICNMVFVGNEYTIIFEDVAKLKKLNTISFDDVLRDLLNIVKRNNIRLESEKKTKEQKRNKILKKTKATICRAAISTLIAISTFGTSKTTIVSAKSNNINSTIQSFENNNIQLQKSTSNDIKNEDRSQEIEASRRTPEDLVNKNSSTNNINEKDEYLKIKGNNISSDSLNENEHHDNSLNDVKEEIQTVENTNTVETKNTIVEDLNYENVVVEEVSAPIETIQLMDTNAKFATNVYHTGVNEVFDEMDTIKISNVSNIIKMMREKGFDEANYPYYIREDGVKMLGNYVMVSASLADHPLGSVVETSLGQGIVCNESGFIFTTNNTSFDVTPEQFDVLCAIVASESDKSADDALAVISVICNRTSDPYWASAFGTSPYNQAIASGQFVVYENGNYKAYLNGRAPESVKQAVADALNGTRNNNYLSFRSNHSKTYSLNMITPTGNRYR